MTIVFGILFPHQTHAQLSVRVTADFLSETHKHRDETKHGLVYTGPLSTPMAMIVAMFAHKLRPLRKMPHV